MATSGTSARAYAGNSHYSIEARWYAESQNIAGNNTTVRVEVWFYSDPSWNINISSRTGTIVIDGTSYNYSTALNSGGGTWVKLGQATKVVTHNGDGTRQFSYSANFPFNVTINQALGTPTASGTGALNTIPRASTITSTVDWTAGTQNLYVSLNAVAGFTHDLVLQVQRPSDGVYVTVATRNGVGSSTTITFTTAENKLIYQTIGGYENRSTWLGVTTKSGGTTIGSQQSKNGTVYGVTPATITFDNFNIGDSIPARMWNMQNVTGFAYTGTFTLGTFSKTFTFAKDDIVPTLTFTTTEIDNMLLAVPDAKQKAGNIYVSSKYDGVEINDGFPVNQNKTFTATVKAENAPTFTTYTYKDSNSTTSGVTGNNQYIIQDKSNLLVEITTANKAVGKKGATIVKYVGTVNGESEEIAYSGTATVSLDFGTITATSSVNLTVTAVDSRGFETQVIKTVNVVPYSKPIARATASRVNNFEDNTVIGVTGDLATLTVNSVVKNDIIETIANATTTPTFTQTANAGSTLAVDTYYVKYTWKNALGETAGSNLGTVSVASGQNLTITVPTKPTGATHARIYMGTTSTVLRYQGETTGTTYVRSTAISTSGALLTPENLTGQVQFRYKLKTSGTYSAWDSFTFTHTTSTFTATSKTLVLDNLSAWDVQVQVIDKIDTTTVTLSVPVGQPIMFMDSAKKSIGVNQFPSTNNSFEVTGQIYHNGDLMFDERTFAFPASAGWYRIAQSKVDIGNNFGSFELWSSVSGYHQNLRLEASIVYGRTSSVTLNQMAHSQWSSATFTKARIVYHTTYSGNYAYLEFYKSYNNTASITVRQSGGRGWGLYQDPVLSNTVPTGYTNKEIVFNDGMIVTGSLDFNSGSNVIGTGAGIANYSYLNFMESDGVTRKGFVGDATNTNSSMYLRSELGSVVLEASSKSLEFTNVGGLLLDGVHVEARGSNTNGEYVKFYGGTQICTHTIWAQSGTGSSIRSMLGIPYPSAFINTPYVIVMHRSISGKFVDHYVYNPDATTFGIYFKPIDNGTSEYGDTMFTILAVGRWKN